MTEPSVSEQELHDYVDGRLDPAGRARVARHLARHPEDRAKVEAWQEINRGLRTLYGAAIDEPVPEKMRKLLRKGRDG